MTQLAPSLPTSDPEPAAVKPSSTGAPKAGFKKKLRFLIPLGVLVAAMGLGVRHWLTRPDDTLIQLSGRIESYESDLGAKVGGRLETASVREGDRVQKDQVIAQLDDRGNMNIKTL